MPKNIWNSRFRENAIPLYKWLSENSKFEGFGMSPMGLAMNGIAKKMDKDFK